MNSVSPYTLAQMNSVGPYTLAQMNSVGPYTLAQVELVLDNMTKTVNGHGPILPLIIEGAQIYIEHPELGHSKKLRATPQKIEEKYKHNLGIMTYESHERYVPATIVLQILRDEIATQAEEKKKELETNLGLFPDERAYVENRKEAWGIIYNDNGTVSSDSRSSENVVPMPQSNSNPSGGRNSLASWRRS